MPAKTKRTPPRTRPLMTWEQAAEYLGITVSRLEVLVYDTHYRGVKYSVIPRVKVGGRVMFNPDELDDWIEENRTDGR